MRLIYIDAGLTSHTSHHADHARALHAACTARGVEFHLIAGLDIPDDLAGEFKALQLFRYNTYALSDGDPISGWLNLFRIAADALLEDLKKIDGITADDIVYFASSQPFILSAVTDWARGLAACPQIFIEVCADPGAVITKTAGPDTLEVTDSRAYLWRNAGSRLVGMDNTRFHVVSLDSSVSALYTTLLKFDVPSVPYPLSPPQPGASRVGKRPILIGTVGSQRKEKGYQFMPDVIRRLQGRDDVRFLLHNSTPNLQPDVQDELQRMAQHDPRLILDERALSRQEWLDLSAQIDLMLCPYEPLRYSQAVSGVALEAFANATPVIGPANTTLSYCIERYEDSGMVFEDWTADSISTAVIDAVGRYDDLARKAACAAELFVASHGAGNMIADILAMAGKT